MKKQTPPPNHPNKNYNPPEQPVKSFKRKPAADPVTILGLGSSSGPLIVSRPGSPAKKA